MERAACDKVDVTALTRHREPMARCKLVCDASPGADDPV